MNRSGDFAEQFADVVNRDSDVARQVEEMLDQLGSPDTKDFLEKYQAAVGDADGLAIIDEYVDLYCKRLTRRAAETAELAGSSAISGRHVRYAADSFEFGRSGSAGLQTSLGVGATLIGTALGVLGSVIEAGANINSGTYWLMIGLGLSGAMLASGSAALLWVKRRVGSA